LTATGAIRAAVDWRRTNDDAAARGTWWVTAGSTSRSHSHLWRTSDGVGLHAPPGVLARDPETGSVCCHFCGRWFQGLGFHVRTHGLSAADYREAVGLSKGRALVAPAISNAISERQSAAYRTSPDVREHFALGHELARNGTLAARSAAANTGDRLETEASRRRALEVGRATTARRRAENRRSFLASAGAATLEEYLRTAYAAGASLERLAEETHLGRADLRRALTAAHIVVRRSGTNTATGKRSRAQRADAAAAAKVGTDDLLAWLTSRRENGATLAELAAAVEHSAPWVKWRLQRVEGP
jgi:hypothetical protein